MENDKGGGVIEFPNPTGRKKKPIDWNEFEKLCHIQCTIAEMAGWLRVGKATLQRQAEDHYKQSFRDVVEQFAKGGQCSLRRTQFKQAQKNVSMSIWLGKQYLGQKDQEKISQAEAVSKSAEALIQAADKLGVVADSKKDADESEQEAD